MWRVGFAEEVRDRWVTAGLITAADFFKGPLAVVPSGPHVGAGPFVEFTGTGGLPSELTQDNAIGYDCPSAQIIVTADSPSVAEAKAKALRENIMSVRNIELGTTWYRQITADQQVFPFPLDAAVRPRSGFNITAIKRPS